MAEWREVSKQEMIGWCAKYAEKVGKKLVRDVLMTGEPPLISFNEFDLGDWPKSMVARYYGEGYGPEGGYSVRVDLMPLQG